MNISKKILRCQADYYEQSNYLSLLLTIFLSMLFTANTLLPNKNLDKIVSVFILIFIYHINKLNYFSNVYSSFIKDYSTKGNEKYLSSWRNVKEEYEKRKRWHFILYYSYFRFGKWTAIKSIFINSILFVISIILFFKN